MKRISSILAFLFISSVLIAQDSTNRIKPSEGDWGLIFRLDGLIQDLKLQGNSDPEGNPILFVRKYIKDDFALRVGVGFNYNHHKTIRKDSMPTPPSYVEFDSVHAQNVLSVALGFEKHIGQMRRIDPYVGADIMMRFIGNERSSWNTLITESTGTTTIQGEVKKDGGYGFGLMGLVGVNFFITKNISVGGEYHMGYDFLRTGGNVSESVITTPTTGSTTSVYARRTDQENNSSFGVNHTASLMLSIFF